MIEIRPPASADELHSVYRLRYAVYVDEMNRVQRHADHDRKVIIEPFDATAVILGAFESGVAVGTVRSNVSAQTDLLFYPHLYEMSIVGSFHPGNTSVTTKLVVAKPFRGTRLAIQLACAIYDAGRERGIEFDFIDCNPDMVSLYERLGYRRYRSEVVHPEYGVVIPMVLALSDLRHLIAVKSPLRSRCVTFGERPATALWSPV